MDTTPIIIGENKREKTLANQWSQERIDQVLENRGYVLFATVVQDFSTELDTLSILKEVSLLNRGRKKSKKSQR